MVSREDRMILCAKQVLPMDAPPIDDGAVVVQGDTVVAVGAASDICAQHAGEARDLGDVVLLPGLINAHCHLDYTEMVNQVEWRGSFIEWVLQLVALKQLYSEKQFLSGIEAGIAQLLKSGTTTVVNIEAFPALIDQLAPSPLRIFWCVEMIDFKRNDPAERLVQEAVAFADSHKNGVGNFGLSPHAPYTSSGELYRLAARFARGHQLLLTTHLAESQEEDDMIRCGSGLMYDYFRRAGRDMRDCKRIGPVQLLHELDVLAPNCLAAHCNCLTPLDVTLLKQSGAHVVHCPKSHRFFHRGTPMLEALQAAGVNVCLGTDSLASNDSLDMFAEMQTLAHEFPRWSAEQILRMATSDAASALGRPEKLGRIAPGALADLITVPLDGSAVDPYEAVVFCEQPVNFSMIGGKEIAL